MATESKLKKLLLGKLKEASDLHVLALREIATAEEVAELYRNAINNIIAYCEERNRY